ncbi:MAG: integrase family protein [Halioglobus sp.]|nr:integrase family protein [Halioglobus sp.]
MARKQHTDYSKPFKFGKTALEGIPRGDRLAYFYDTVIPQLGVTRQLSGKLTFHVRTTVNGKTKRIGISNGRFPGMVVDDAREKARTLLQDATRGTDPVADRRTQRAVDTATGLTVESAVETYLAEKRTGKQKLTLKESTKKDYRKDIKRLLGDDYYSGALVAVTEDIIAKRVRLMEKRSKAKTASGCRSLAAVWNWTRKQKQNRGLIPENPVTLYAESVDGLYVAERKTNYLPAEYLPAWFDAVESLDDAHVAQFFQFLLLTGVRLNEAMGLCWEHIDFKTNTYRIRDPKNRKPVELPLPGYLRERLYQRRQREGVVFDIPKDGRTYRAKVAEAIEFKWTNHDLRRTFSTYGLKVCDLVKVKLLMNHLLSGDVTMGYVQRQGLDLASDLERIDNEILRLAGRPVDNVVRLEAVK